MDKVLDKNIKSSWFELSLPAQMINIGNEVKRAFRFSDVNKQNNFLDKAISYIELTSKDSKNQKVFNEIIIGIDVLNNFKNQKETNYTKQQVIDYYSNFIYYL